MADMSVRTPPSADPRASARPTSTPTPQGTPASGPTAKPAPAATPTPTPASAPAAKSAESTPSSFDARATRPTGNGGVVPEAAVKLGTPEAPVKRPVTFIYDAGPHNV